MYVWHYILRSSVPPRSIRIYFLDVVINSFVIVPLSIVHVLRSNNFRVDISKYIYLLTVYSEYFWSLPNQSFTFAKFNIYLINEWLSNANLEYAYSSRLCLIPVSLYRLLCLKRSLGWWQRRFKIVRYIRQFVQLIDPTRANSLYGQVATLYWVDPTRANSLPCRR